MKKKVCLILMFLLCSMSIFCAKDMMTDKTHYYDEATGYEGWTSLMPIGTEAAAKEYGFTFDQLIEEIKEQMATEGAVSDCLKLSKREIFLVWASLKVFDYEDGESYIIIISDTPSDDDQKALCLLVTVTDGGRRFDWNGFYCVETESGNSNEFGDDNLKHYYDKKTGYEGWANIEFIGMNSELEKQGIDFTQVAALAKEEALKAGEPVITDCNELSELESFLVLSALNEYDYEEGETYIVGITTQEPAKIESALCLFVTITDGGKSFNWSGFYFSEN